MKFLSVLFFGLFTALVNASEVSGLSSDDLKARVTFINELQNKILMKGSLVKDIDALFSNFTDDFTYVHEIYGGTYSREHLYNNYVKFLKAGNYQRTADRYRIVSMIAGHNAISIEREQTYEGVTSNHLTVFEFKGKQVSKIIEYWK
ncbi:hypothetical protein [Thalassomonas sp. RHCl1]|uniref:hypothetical protein n=1 Tax=Thalassomonas sp. RHCl1 TaxID=2995320 RepID=UPI00248C09B7|nr:hypothetical protein [Thalassomonas sp. RHCl1]